MQLIFIYGPPASGKLTVARELATLTGFAVFHNHLIVDAVSSVFPFGTPVFIALRESLWLAVIGEAAREERSLLFTFAPEPTVAPDFPERTREMVERAGGSVAFVRLAVPIAEQEKRLQEESRREFGKMRSVELLRQLRDDFERCEAGMPPASVTMDTGQLGPREAAAAIATKLGLPSLRSARP